MTELFQLLSLIFANPLLKITLGFFAINTVLGIVKALFKEHDFRLGSVADWLGQTIPLLMGAAGVQAAVFFATGSQWDQQMQLVSNAVWSFVVLALVGKFLKTLQELGFTQIPMAMTDRPKGLSSMAP